MDKQRDLFIVVGSLGLVVLASVGYLIIKGNSGFHVAEGIFYIGIGVVFPIEALFINRTRESVNLIGLTLCSIGAILSGISIILGFNQPAWLPLCAHAIFFVGLATIVLRRSARPERTRIS